jgi:hypothetical protein
MHGLPRDREAAFHLRAYRNVFHILPKRFGKKPVQFMTTVITDILTQQAGADTQFNLFHYDKLPFIQSSPRIFFGLSATWFSWMATTVVETSYFDPVILQKEFYLLWPRNVHMKICKKRPQCWF